MVKLKPDLQSRDPSSACKELRDMSSILPNAAKFRGKLLDRVPRYKGVLCVSEKEFTMTQHSLIDSAARMM